MEPNNNQIPRIIFLFSLIFFTAQGVCVPRNLLQSPGPSPQPSNSTPPISHVSAPSGAFSNPPESAPTLPPSPMPMKENLDPSTPPNYTPHQAPSSSPVSHITAPTPALNSPSESAPSPLQTQSDSPNSAPNPTSEPSTPASMDPAIKKICDSTDYPALCLSTLAPFLSDKTDPISVLEMAIKACTQHVNDAIATASVITNVHKARTDSGNIPIFKDCIGMYNDALDNLQSAMDAIPARDIGTINIMLSAALSDFVTCEDEFNGETSELSPYDDKGTKMASNCLAITSLIK